MSPGSATTSNTIPIAPAARLATALVAGLLGVFVLLGAGFAHPDLLHNAAHDTRHAFTFPCH
ncbi:MAG: CbtB-domain containing protein [Alphaproteobacteria bacterium]